MEGMEKAAIFETYDPLLSFEEKLDQYEKDFMKAIWN